MRISRGDTVFLFFIGLIVFINLVRFLYYRTKLKGLRNKLNTEPADTPAPGEKYGIFSNIGFTNTELEYLRIKTRESLKSAIIFFIGLIMAFVAFLFGRA